MLQQEVRRLVGDLATVQSAACVYAEGADTGAAWKYTSEAGVDFLSVSLDDPSFPGPVNAKLFTAENGFDLVWTRPAKRKDAEQRPGPTPDDET